MKSKGKLPIQTSPVPVKIVSDVAKEPVENMKWKAQDALRDIQRAEEHLKDKTLMKAVKTLAKEQTKALSKICGK